MEIWIKQKMAGTEKLDRPDLPVAVEVESDSKIGLCHIINSTMDVAASMGFYRPPNRESAADMCVVADYLLPKLDQQRREKHTQLLGYVSIKQIADELGMYPASIHNALRRLGITIGKVRTRAKGKQAAAISQTDYRKFMRFYEGLILEKEDKPK